MVTRPITTQGPELAVGPQRGTPLLIEVDGGGAAARIGWPVKYLLFRQVSVFSCSCVGAIDCTQLVRTNVVPKFALLM